MANRISELEVHLRRWERDKRRRTAAFTLIPIAAAIGAGWYAYDRVDSVEQGVDRTLAALEMPVEPGLGPEARLARLEEAGQELQSLRPLTAELATAEEERAAAEAALAAVESELATANDTAATVIVERDRLAAELEAATAAADERLAQANAEAEALRAEQAALQRRIDLAERERAALSKIAAERQAALDAADDARATAEGRSRELEAELEKVRSSLVAQLATTGSKLAAAQKELEEARSSDAVAVDERVAELERQLELSERTVTGLQTVRDDLEDRLAESEDALMAAEAAGKEEAAKHQAALAELQGQHEADAEAMAELERQLQLAERTVTGLQAVRDDLEGRLAETEDALMAAEAAGKEAAAKQQAALAELRGQREVDAAAAAELERQLQLSERTVTGLQAIRDDLEGRLAETEDALMAAETARKEEAATQQAALAELRGQREADAAAAAELERQLQLSERTVVGLQAVRDDLEDRLAETEDALMAAEAASKEESATHQAALAELQHQHEADAAAAAELERQLQLSERTVTGLQAIRDDLEGRLAKTQDALIATEATESEQMAALRAELAERERDLAAAEAAQADLEDRQVAGSAMLDAQKAELAELQRRLGLAERTAAGLQTVRDELEVRLAKTEDALIAKESAESETVARLESELAGREDALAASEAALAELEAKLAATEAAGNEAVQAVRAELAKRETALAAAEEEFEVLASGREADAAALAARATELAELRRRLELAEWSRSGLEAARDELEAELAAAEAAGNEAAQAAQAELVKRETALAAAEEELEAMASGREADAAMLATRDAQLTELQRRLELAEWSRDGLEAARDELETKLAAVEAAGNEVAAALRRDLAEREQAMARIEAALLEAGNEREADAAALAARSAELAGLQRQLELAAWTKSGLEAARDDLETRLAAAEARGAAFEQQVAALEAELEATAASVPLVASENSRPMAEILDLDAATRDRLAAQAAELAELRAETKAQAELLAEREAEIATIEAERQAEVDRRLGLIGEQLGSSLRPVAVSREAAEGAVERELRLSADVLAAADGGDDVALLSGRNVAFTAGLMFPSAEAELTPQGRAALNQVALELKQLIDALPEDLPWMLRIDGHTDDLPIRSGRFHNNWELSAARASSVAEYLVEWGLPADRLIAAGFADTQPLVQGRSEESRSRNRRIELKLTVR